MELTPTSITSESLSKKESALLKAGITDEKVMKSLHEHLVAGGVRRDWVLWEEGDARTNDLPGRWVETFEPNYQVQEKAQEKIIRIKGWSKEVEGTSLVVNNISITSEEFKRLLEEDRKVKRSGQTGEIIDVASYK